MTNTTTDPRQPEPQAEGEPQQEQFASPPQQAGGTAELARQLESGGDEGGTPRQAVQQADELVAGAIKRLAQTFADERSQLEGQWDRGDEVSTEDLLVALQKYRSFFGRLLAV